MTKTEQASENRDYFLHRKNVGFGDHKVWAWGFWTVNGVSGTDYASKADARNAAIKALTV